MYRGNVNMQDLEVSEIIHPRVLRVIRPALLPCSPKASFGDKEQPKEGSLKRNVNALGEQCIKCN